MFFENHSDIAFDWCGPLPLANPSRINWRLPLWRLRTKAITSVSWER